MSYYPKNICVKYVNNLIRNDDENDDNIHTA